MGSNQTQRTASAVSTGASSAGTLLPDDRIIAFDKTYTDKRDDTKDDLIRALRVGNDIAALMEEDGWPGLGIELTITPIYGPADQDFYDCLFPDSRSGGSDSHPSLKSVLGEPDAAYIACDKEGRVHVSRIAMFGLKHDRERVLVRTLMGSRRRPLMFGSSVIARPTSTLHPIPISRGRRPG